MERNERKIRVGKVVSDKMDKTVVVAVEYKTQHKLYKKPIISTVKFKAHDENNECHVAISYASKKPVRCPSRNTGEL